MKHIFFAILFSVFHFVSSAQNCNSQAHSTNERDSWLSCTTNGDHWIVYDLGYVYGIEGSRFWNYNVAGNTDRGFKNTKIEHSLDGSNWITLTTFLLPQASGRDTYEGVVGPDFAGVTARYIRISSVDTWGNGTCAGLSEVLFEVNSVVGLETVSEDASTSDIRIYPNPVGQQLNLEWAAEIVVDEMSIIDVSGHEVYRFSGTNRQDVSHLPAGMYLLKVVGTDGNVWSRKFVKE